MCDHHSVVTTASRVTAMSHEYVRMSHGYVQGEHVRMSNAVSMSASADASADLITYWHCRCRLDDSICVRSVRLCVICHMCDHHSLAMIMSRVDSMAKSTMVPGRKSVRSPSLSER